MPKLDPFSAQIVQLVREMPDEAILELVRNKLGADDEVVAAAVSAPARKAKATRRKKASAKRKPAAKKAVAKKAAPKKKKAATKKRRPKKKAAPKKRAVAKKTAPKRKKAATKKRATAKRGGGDRQRELDAVERAIRSSKGLSASDIVKRTKLPRARVSAAVRQLKEAKRIHQGGDRRFARYAADAKTAKAASELARTTASGPKRKR